MPDDFAQQHAAGKFRLVQSIKMADADKDPGDGVYRIRPLHAAMIVLGPSHITISPTIAYDDPHMIALIENGGIQYRVVSGEKPVDGAAPQLFEPPKRGRRARANVDDAPTEE